MLRSLAVLVLFAPVPLFAADDAPILNNNTGLFEVSAEHKRVFAAANGGGLEALDLETGKPVWANADAARVAGATAKRVYGWVPVAKKPTEFHVVAIDAATGKTLGKAGPVTVPEWATVAKGFRAAARDDGEGAVVVWQAWTRYSQGPPPSPEALAAATKDADGFAKLDFATGKAVPGKGKPTAADLKLLDGLSAPPKVGTLTFVSAFRGTASDRVNTVELLAITGDKVVWKRNLTRVSIEQPLP